MKKIFCKRRMQKLNNMGTTLIELMTAFALLGMFMVQASLVISSITSAYYNIKGTDMGMQVADVLLDKIAAQLENAQNVSVQSEDYMDSSNMPLTGSLIIAADAVEFRNGSGSHVKICVDGEGNQRYLALHYYAVSAVNEETGVSEEIYKAVDWKYDSAMYMGYYISDIRFSQAGEDYDSNIIRVELELESSLYGGYKTQQLIRCYNLDSSSEIVTYSIN